MLKVIRPKDMAKFTFPAHPDEMTVSGMMEFADKIILNDDFKPDKLSQPVPETQSGPVTEIVGSNFYDFVK